MILVAASGTYGQLADKRQLAHRDVECAAVQSWNIVQQSLLSRPSALTASQAATVIKHTAVPRR